MLQHAKLLPITMPQIVTPDMSTSLEHLLHSMTPFSSHALRSWLGCHLANTDFQWPDVLLGY